MHAPLLIALSLILPPQNAYAKRKDKELIPNLQTVHAGKIYRGGTPGVAGVKYLKSIGVKTIISLDRDEKEMEIERKAAKAAGMNWFSMPMNALKEPAHKDVNTVLDILSNPGMQPAFVHCQHGRDRTGLIIGLYRVLIDKWQPAHAYEEMEKYGFRAFLWGVRRYFEKRTGFNI